MCGRCPNRPTLLSFRHLNNLVSIYISSTSSSCLSNKTFFVMTNICLTKIFVLLSIATIANEGIKMEKLSKWKNCQNGQNCQNSQNCQLVKIFVIQKRCLHILGALRRMKIASIYLQCQSKHLKYRSGLSGRKPVSKSESVTFCFNCTQ